MLEVRNLSVSYGSLRVLHHVSLEVAQDEIVALVGANGAGKSTALMAIAGLIERQSGEVRFNERAVPMRAEDVVSRGIRLVPEGRRVFSSLTVRENLRVGAHVMGNRDRDTERQIERVEEYFPILRQRQDQLAGTLSGGEQQMLAIGRALVAAPRLVMIDELSLGLAPQIVSELFEIIRTLNEEENTAFLLVEQFATAALDLAERGYVLERGRITYEGPASEIAVDDTKLRAAYLGADGGASTRDDAAAVRSTP